MPAIYTLQVFDYMLSFSEHYEYLFSQRGMTCTGSFSAHLSNVIIRAPYTFKSYRKGVPVSSPRVTKSKYHHPAQRSTISTDAKGVGAK